MLTFSSVATLEQLEKKNTRKFLLSLTGVRSHGYAEVPIILRELLRPSELVTNLWMTSV